MALILNSNINHEPTIQNNNQHYELCELTAKKISKRNKIVVYEYQSFASWEYPDVLCYGNTTTLFEIKTSYSDFKADLKKDSRKKYRIKYSIFEYYPKLENKHYSLYQRVLQFPKIQWKQEGIDVFIQEAPHLGKFRYYVCPEGLIPLKDLETSNWGLYYVTSKGKFIKKNRVVSFEIIYLLNNKYFNTLLENMFQLKIKKN